MLFLKSNRINCQMHSTKNNNIVEMILKNWDFNRILLNLPWLLQVLSNLTFKSIYLLFVYKFLFC